ncbi:expressed unknown protein [Seminavis robusta]|uniref:Uncharacterized protein n=1 Tax=Seminavis robusta TaxID=568900 RepID=A0A9N8EMK4_9STRA|nr:expressed unknown protein [Seminavis robusta]|eukprot:Sro1370_g267040.1 n/a (99) ;mRNA; r:20804-21100
MASSTPMDTVVVPLTPSKRKLEELVDEVAPSAKRSSESGPSSSSDAKRPCIEPQVNNENNSDKDTGIRKKQALMATAPTTTTNHIHCYHHHYKPPCRN